VTYNYPLTSRPAIKNLNLKIEEGKFYGVVGANGSGKTTLCALIRGFAPSFYHGELKGEVLVDGKPTEWYGAGDLALRIGLRFRTRLTRSAA
jgi:energy-coupling factor transport system ATP-binding protein